MNLFNKLSQIRHAIGNTPLVEIHCKYQGQPRRVFAKLEYYNLTGSIKDRMAYQMYSEAYRRGSLKKGDHIAEATSGNAGIAITAIGRYLGHPVTIFMPDWMSEERKNIMRSFGADIRLISAEQGGFIGSIEQTHMLKKNQSHTFLTHQFSNPDNTLAHYTGTAPEICRQLAGLNLEIQAFVAGVGTGGTVMGVGRYLKEKNPAIKVHPAEPANSPTLKTGIKHGKHRIQGVSDDFIPEIVDLSLLDEIIDVDDGDAIIIAQQLAKTLGLAVGISSGANFIAALQAQDLLNNEDAIVATVFADDNKKYLSTDLMKPEPMKAHFYSNHIEFTDMIIYR